MKTKLPLVLYLIDIDIEQIYRYIFGVIPNWITLNPALFSLGDGRQARGVTLPLHGVSQCFPMFTAPCWNKH